MNPRTVGLFVKTFKPDLPWLFHALQSFELNWRHNWSATELLVVAEPDCEAELRRWAFTHVKVRYVTAWPDGYTHAMAMKMSADIFLPQCELILLFDSDFMLIRPTTLEDLMSGGSPVLQYDIWHSDIDQQTRQVSKKVWGPAVRRSTGRDLDVDWMVDPLWLFWSSTFQGARALIEKHCGMPFLQAVYSPHFYDWHRFLEHPMKFCDLQTLGIYAKESESHKYDIRQRIKDDRESPLRQAWSHSVDGPSSLSQP